MATPRRESMDFIIKLDKEHFSIRDALNLDLNFIKRFEGVKGGKIL